MAKVLRCNEVMPGCPAEIRGESEEDVMRRAGEHAKQVHGVATIDEETAGKVRAAIRAE